MSRRELDPNVMKKIRADIKAKRDEYKASVFYKVHQTINKMMKARRYHPINDIEIDLSSISYNEFRNLYSNLKDMEAIYTNGKENLVIMYVQYDKFNIDAMRSLVSHVYELMIRHVIIVNSTDLTPKAKKEVLNIDILNIEFYTYTSLTHDITQHINSPTLSIVDTLPSRLSLDTIKTISINDPQSKYYGFKINDIIMIQHRDEVSEYRRVVNS